MGTITIGLTGSGVVNGTKTYSINDAAVTDLIALVRANTNPNKYNGGTDTRTDGQVLAAWADGVINQTKTRVTRSKKGAAARAAANAEGGIVIT